MGAGFLNPSLVHDNDFIRMLDGGQAVGNHYGGTALHQPGKRLGYQGLGFRIDIGRGFVQYQDGGLIGQRPGKGKELPLPG